MTEQISLNYEKIVWTYDELDRASEDSFDFTSGESDPESSAYVLEPVLVPSFSTGGSSGGDQTSFGGDGSVKFIIENVEAGGQVFEPNLRSDGELVQAVSDADMSGDFIF